MTARLEMVARFTDGTAYTLHSVEDSAANRRTVDRMAWHLAAKPNVVSIDVAVPDWADRRVRKEPMMADPLAPARGILLAVLLSLPFWALVIWAVVR